MTGSRWTILLVRGDETSVRQFSFSRSRLRWIAVASSAVMVALIGLLAVVGKGTSAEIRAARLADRNQILEDELTRIRQRVGTLEGTLSEIAVRDRDNRILAGLDPIDEEVLEVGIGGPGTPSLSDHPLWALDSVASKEAFAVSYDLNALERRVRLLSRSLAEAGDSLAAHRDLLQSTPSILPAAGMVSSGFSKSRLHPIHHRRIPHEGVDLSAPEGTPILAAAKGRVVVSGWRSGLGQAVRIDHGYGYETQYGHASKLLVRVGQEVERGDIIALVGNTGLATAPHLHYEVWVSGTPVNPMNYVLEAIP